MIFVAAVSASVWAARARVREASASAVDGAGAAGVGGVLRARPARRTRPSCAGTPGARYELILAARVLGAVSHTILLRRVALRVNLVDLRASVAAAGPDGRRRRLERRGGRRSIRSAARRRRRRLRHRHGRELL